MFQLGLRRSLALGTARRFATAPPKTSAQPVVGYGTQLRSLAQPRLVKYQELARPLSAVAHMLPRAPWAAGASICPASTPQALPPLAQPAQSAAQAKAAAEAAAETSSAVESVHSDGMVFEIGLSFVVSHYIHIFMSLMRCLFQAFRPILILFVFGQILKAVFFVAGAPIWLSFYSIWMFEVFYGLVQCIISFIFISFFYNNLSFQQLRPAMRHQIRQLWAQAQMSLARGRAAMRA